MRTQTFVLHLFFCLLHGTAFAQSAKSDRRDLYLPPLAAAEKAVSGVSSGTSIGVDGSKSSIMISKPSSELQELAVWRSFVGDTDGAIAAYDSALGARSPHRSMQPPAVSDDVHAEDAIHAIVEQARSKRVVLINEAHHLPMNRAFTMKLAAELRKIGYSYLACEAFALTNGAIDEVATRQATMETGYLVRDPVFAGFVNAALAAGWKLVPYEYEARPTPGEDPRERINARERAQAHNLVERIFAKDKNAKVLIHVGYGQLYKSLPEDKDMPVLMGEYLHRMTGLDMLHVDQTSFYAHPDRTHEAPTYAELVEKFPLKAPFVLRSADGSYAVLRGLQGRVDMQVVFPRYPNHNGRPDWLHTLAGRSPRPLPAEILPTQGRRLVKAFSTDAVKNAVPADIVVVRAGEPAPVLMLPQGEFRYTYEDGER